MESPVKTLQIYLDEAGEWRWRGLAGNHRSVAVSGEGYTNHDDCVDEGVALFPTANVQDPQPSQPA